jgi:hypothetical protein
MIRSRKKTNLPFLRRLPQTNSPERRNINGIKNLSLKNINKKKRFECTTSITGEIARIECIYSTNEEAGGGATGRK